LAIGVLDSDGYQATPSPMRALLSDDHRDPGRRRGRHRAAVRHSAGASSIRLVEVRAEEHRTADFRTRLHVRPYADDRFLDQALVEITAIGHDRFRKSQSLNREPGRKRGCV